MTIEDFKDIFNPIYMENVLKIIEKGDCAGIHCDACPLSVNNQKIGLRNCIPEERVLRAKDFKKMVDEENDKIKKEFPLGLEYEVTPFELKKGMKIIVVDTGQELCFSGYDEKGRITCNNKTWIFGNKTVDWEATKKLSQVAESPNLKSPEDEEKELYRKGLEEQGFPKDKIEEQVAYVFDTREHDMKVLIDSLESNIFEFAELSHNGSGIENSRLICECWEEINKIKKEIIGRLMK